MLPDLSLFAGSLRIFIKYYQNSKTLSTITQLFWLVYQQFNLMPDNCCATYLALSGSDRLGGGGGISYACLHLFFILTLTMLQSDKITAVTRSRFHISASGNIFCVLCFTWNILKRKKSGKCFPWNTIFTKNSISAINFIRPKSNFTKCFSPFKGLW